MISINRVKKYCSEPIELIENYDKAVSDTERWDCHHRWETDFGYSVEELIEIGEYYGVSADKLIFLTVSEHTKLHIEKNGHIFLGRHHTEETKEKLREFRLGKHTPHSEETKRKMSVAATNGKNSKSVIQYTLDGEFVNEYPSTHEVNRQFGYHQGLIAKCCRGESKTAYKFIWKYKQ